MAMSMICLLMLSAVSAGHPRGPDLTLDYSYDDYLVDFRKPQPQPADYAARSKLFQERLAAIVLHNSQKKSHVKGVNHLTDVFQVPKGLKRSPEHLETLRMSELPAFDDVRGLPDHVDWREKGVVTAVKDQGGCGSCWAFAVTETMESHVALATGALFDLAPQELVSCMPNDDQCGGTGGCAGATAELGFDYYVNNGGVVQEFQMGYESYHGKSPECSLSKVNSTSTRIAGAVATIESYKKLPVNDYAALMNALAKVGPIAVSVDASWADYESGVFESDDYDAHIDHAVVLVGYGTDKRNGPYWLIRNSWSPTWGEGGYIRLRRHTDKAPCGVDMFPLDGTGCKGGPSNITVCGTSGVLSDSSYPLGAKLL